MRDHRTMLFSMVAVVGIALAAGACGDGPTGPEQASLTVRMTDAAGDLEAAWVSVTEVRLAGEGAPSDAVLTTETGDELIRLSPDAVTELVTGAEIDPGTYGQLRLLIDGGVVETTDGEVFTFGGAEHPDGLASDGTMTCPSCTQTGVKVNVGGDLQLEAASTILMLDFNVPESFGHEAGASGSFVMRPTITSSTVELSGNIVGDVTVETASLLDEVCGGQDVDVTDLVPRAVLVSDETVSQTGVVTADGQDGTRGSYAIDFLAEGDYRMETEPVEFALDGGGTATLSFDVSVETGDDDAVVTVQSGQDATADYTITGVSCPTS